MSVKNLTSDPHIRGMQSEEEAGMEDFPDRVGYIINSTCAGDVNTFSELCSISTSSLRSYLRGESEPKRTALIDMAAAANVRVEWLVQGEGSPHSDDDYLRCVYPPETAMQLIIKSESNGIQTPKELLVPSRVVSKLSLSRAWFNYVSADPERCIPVLCSDYTMAPTMNMGDILVVDSSSNSVREGVYFVVYQNTPEFRRLMRMPDGTIRIIFDNEKYESVLTPSCKKNDIIILGRVRYILRGQEL